MARSPRRWLEVSVRSTTAGDRAPLIVEGLLVLGGRASEERDGWYVTHVEAPDDLEAFLAHASATLRHVTGLDSIELRTDWRDHEDWAESWKRGLKARPVTDRLLVRPSWISPPADYEGIDIVLDPGMAFGTAEHGTTRGCLRLLDRAVLDGHEVLDVGAGSGILAIAAARLGAAEVVAIEADPLACEALRENIGANGVADRVRCIELQADAADIVGFGPADGIVANIESGVLTLLMPGLSGALRSGGWLILSGVMTPDWPDIQTRAEAFGLAVVDLDRDGDLEHRSLSSHQRLSCPPYQRRSCRPLGQGDGVPATDVDWGSRIDSATEPTNALSESQGRTARSPGRVVVAHGHDPRFGRRGRRREAAGRTPGTPPGVEQAEAVRTCLERGPEARPVECPIDRFGHELQ